MKILWHNFLINMIVIIYFLIMLTAWQISFMVSLIVASVLILLFLICFKLFPNFKLWKINIDNKMLYKQHHIMIPVFIIIFYFIFAFISIKFWNINSILYLFIILSVTNFIYSIEKK
ncbi:hypothetical protein DYZ97_04295 [Apilactobacillus timberlakei]|nr:hypothetical protein DYZ97_04295 [Apilactobacillus timberlakei]